MKGDKAEKAAWLAEQEREELAALEAQHAQQMQTLREQVGCQNQLSQAITTTGRLHQAHVPDVQ
jgi:hypothetical protein